MKMGRLMLTEDDSGEAVGYWLRVLSPDQAFFIPTAELGSLVALAEWAERREAYRRAEKKEGGR